MWVPFETGKPKKIWGSVLGRRSQYGVRLRVASTIHASQGATLAKMVTAITNTSAHPNLDFSLWEAAQVVVLISRTRSCSDIYFIGKPDEVAEQLLSVLNETNKHMSFIQSLTQRLCGDPLSITAIPRPPIFRPCDIILEAVPAVYLLVSTRNVGYMYIGQTDNIRKRLNQHNSGHGSKFTNNARLRPWALFGYVQGFQKKSERLNFEGLWKRRAMEHVVSRQCRTPDGALRLAVSLAAIKNQTRTAENKLSVQQCGQMENEDSDFIVVDNT